MSNISTNNERESLLEVARLTPMGRGAVACVGVRGTRSLDVLMERWRRADRAETKRPDSPLRPYFGLFRFDELDNTDEEIVLRVRTPNALELDCHGGIAVSSRLMDFFKSRGARVVTDDEWECDVEREETELYSDAPLPSRRFDLLFYSGSDALLTRTTTERTTIIASEQRELWKSWFGSLLTKVAASNRAALDMIDAVLKTRELGHFLTNPIKVALVGIPNAGKSSLLNASVGYDRALTSSVSGTTRDLVGVQFVYDGWNIYMIDGAGLRETEDPLERAGTFLVRDNAASADVVVRVYDPTLSRKEQDAVLSNFLQKSEAMKTSNEIDVLNKIDLQMEEWKDDWKFGDNNVIKVSAKTREGLDQFLRAISGALTKEIAANGSETPLVASDEQADYLLEIRNMLEREDWSRALTYLKRETTL